MTRLNQILAVEAGVVTDTERTLAEATRILQAPGPLSGITKTYAPRDEEGEQLPGEGVRVQTSCEQVLEQVAAAMTRLLDVALTREVANTEAKADLRVGGQVLLPQVPAGFLGHLIRQLDALGKLLAKAPVLDPAENWHADTALPDDVLRSDPKDTVRTQRRPEVLVLAPATPQHPAQTKVYEVDTIVGRYTTVKFSGALPAARKQRILDRLRELREAARIAREDANTIEVTGQEAGEAVMGYLLG